MGGAGQQPIKLAFNSKLKLQFTIIVSFSQFVSFSIHLAALHLCQSPLSPNIDVLFGLKKYLDVQLQAEGRRTRHLKNRFCRFARSVVCRARPIRPLLLRTLHSARLLYLSRPRTGLVWWDGKGGYCVLFCDLVDCAVM